eukprot:240021_1
MTQQIYASLDSGDDEDGESGSAAGLSKRAAASGENVKQTININGDDDDNDRQANKKQKMSASTSIGQGMDRVFDQQGNCHDELNGNGNSNDQSYNFDNDDDGPLAAIDLSVVLANVGKSSININIRSEFSQEDDDDDFAQIDLSLAVTQSRGSISSPSSFAVVPKAATEKRLNLLGDDIMFVVVDCETTGLDKSCHIIQLAAKLLGSDDENDLFSEYILPPIKEIPEKIQRLTGITHHFLCNGGYDPALGKDLPRAREFRHVFADFQAFCNRCAKSKGLKEAVLIAHNAKFDVQMINAELRRWNSSEHAASVSLGDIFSSSLDSLSLFREKKWWQSSIGGKENLPRPSSFSLSKLHQYVLKKPITNSHNAVGDIKALESLLLSKNFDGWKVTYWNYLSKL